MMGRMGMAMSESRNQKSEIRINSESRAPGRRGALFVFIFALSGCTVGPNYHYPATTAPDAWGELGESGAATAPATRPSSGSRVVQWWKTFGDADLDGLIDRGVSSNLG